MQFAYLLESVMNILMDYSYWHKLMSDKHPK